MKKNNNWLHYAKNIYLDSNQVFVNIPAAREWASFENSLRVYIRHGFPGHSLFLDSLEICLEAEEVWTEEEWIDLEPGRDSLCSPCPALVRWSIWLALWSSVWLSQMTPSSWRMSVKKRNSLNPVGTCHEATRLPSERVSQQQQQQQQRHDAWREVKKLRDWRENRARNYVNHKGTC